MTVVDATAVDVTAVAVAVGSFGSDGTGWTKLIDTVPGDCDCDSGCCDCDSTCQSWAKVISDCAYSTDFLSPVLAYAKSAKSTGCNLWGQHPSGGTNPFAKAATEDAGTQDVASTLINQQPGHLMEMAMSSR